MTKKNQIYKCNVCGNIVEILHEAAGELVCCNQPMNLLQENTEDAAQEKHVPVIKETQNGILVKVGEIPHPMEKDHFIEWIEVIAGDQNLIKHLAPGDLPQAEFCIDTKDVIVREYCNLHGLWKA